MLTQTLLSPSGSELSAAVRIPEDQKRFASTISGAFMSLPTDRSRLDILSVIQEDQITDIMKEPDRLHRVAVQYQNMNFIKNNVKSLLVEKRKKKRCAVQYSSQ